MKKIKCNFKFMIFVMVVAVIVTQISSLLMNHFEITNYFMGIGLDILLAGIIIYVLNKFGFINWLISKNILDAEDL